jgi:RNA polymerase sigma factor (sigma-70 family)
MTKRQPFERVVAEHGAAILRVCRAVLGPHTDADDAWSETFLAALRAWPDLPDDANVEAWLVTIAHRKAIDVTRSRARHAVPVPDVPDGPDVREEIGTLQDRDDDLWEAVRRLPDKQRMAVAYHHLAGLPYREVAEILGGTSAAARRAASDGIATLRSAYGRTPAHPEGALP